MKKYFASFCAAALAVALFAGAAPQAAAGIVVVPHVGSIEAMYDAVGIPIWGYGTKGRAIYAYDPDGLPIYAFERVYSGCYVPTWDFLPGYHGPKWPRGIHRKGHKSFRPKPGPAPHPGANKPGPEPHPGAHKPGFAPHPGANKPGVAPHPGSNRPGAGGPGGGGKPGSRH